MAKFSATANGLERFYGDDSMGNQLGIQIEQSLPCTFALLVLIVFWADALGIAGFIYAPGLNDFSIEIIVSCVP